MSSTLADRPFQNPASWSEDTLMHQTRDPPSDFDELRNTRGTTPFLDDLLTRISHPDEVNHPTLPSERQVRFGESDSYTAVYVPFQVVLPGSFGNAVGQLPDDGGLRNLPRSWATRSLSRAMSALEATGELERIYPDIWSQMDAGTKMLLASNFMTCGVQATLMDITPDNFSDPKPVDTKLDGWTLPHWLKDTPLWIAPGRDIYKFEWLKGTNFEGADVYKSVGTRLTCEQHECSFSLDPGYLYLRRDSKTGILTTHFGPTIRLCGNTSSRGLFGRLGRSVIDAVTAQLHESKILRRHHMKDSLQYPSDLYNVANEATVAVLQSFGTKCDDLITARSYRKSCDINVSVSDPIGGQERANYLLGECLRSSYPSRKAIEDHKEGNAKRVSLLRELNDTIIEQVCGDRKLEAYTPENQSWLVCDVAQSAVQSLNDVLGCRLAMLGPSLDHDLKVDVRYIDASKSPEQYYGLDETWADQARTVQTIEEATHIFPYYKLQVGADADGNNADDFYLRPWQSSYVKLPFRVDGTTAPTVRVDGLQTTETQSGMTRKTPPAVRSIDMISIADD